jgi:hypothetical protein
MSIDWPTAKQVVTDLGRPKMMSRPGPGIANAREKDVNFPLRDEPAGIRLIKGKALGRAVY